MRKLTYVLMAFYASLVIIACAPLGTQTADSTNTYKGSVESVTHNVTQNQQLLEPSTVLLITVLATMWCLTAIDAGKYKYPWLAIVKWALLIGVTAMALWRLLL